jgi:hypothetical protein
MRIRENLPEEAKNVILNKIEKYARDLITKY